MKHFLRILCLLIVVLTGLLPVMPVLAIPPLPSSFYGTVKVNGQNVPDGTGIEAAINGQVVAQALSQTYQGDSVYALNVPGDDPDTAALEGGHDGDTIVFKVGGAQAEQTGTWKSATNISLDLSVSAAATLTPPEDTPTPMPTQTSVDTGTLPTATQSAKATATPKSTATTAKDPGATQGSDLPGTTLATTTVTTPGADPGAGAESEGNNSGKIILILGIILGIALLFSIIWVILKRSTKASNYPDQ